MNLAGLSRVCVAAVVAAVFTVQSDFHPAIRANLLFMTIATLSGVMALLYDRKGQSGSLLSAFRSEVLVVSPLHYSVLRWRAYNRVACLFLPLTWLPPLTYAFVNVVAYVHSVGENPAPSGYRTVAAITAIELFVFLLFIPITASRRRVEVPPMPGPTPRIRSRLTP